MRPQASFPRDTSDRAGPLMSGIQFSAHRFRTFATIPNSAGEWKMVTPAASDAVDRARQAVLLATAALEQRPHRRPDFAAESEALHRLARALTTSANAMLQELA